MVKIVMPIATTAKIMSIVKPLPIQAQEKISPAQTNEVSIEQTIMKPKNALSSRETLEIYITDNKKIDELIY
ncbi:MAG: hypothetical protein FK733_05240 [Asgard group archaeon]|nr:hypothetical protein [Asgard group archaeon]